MENSEFRGLATAVLDSLQQQADAWFQELDIDVDGARNGSMLTLTFLNRSPVIVNIQAPVQELWVATPGQGYHYRRREEDGQWHDIRTDEVLEQTLSRICSDFSGRPLTVSIPTTSVI
ncbi:iron donor protein CyaY [Burkholderia vietnamiensis]|uniref:iron donor protein CyaY n=1 Tax=Burkholderia vietnamiensis TaxID=60552 RepID=UPI001D15BE14|nr:iron donor protein CyaY [Burkholderia vietnamiensis]UEC01716.1 iron donor protein CyaY [Burkholderia vietnamiensis]